MDNLEESFALTKQLIMLNKITEWKYALSNNLLMK